MWILVVGPELPQHTGLTATGTTACDNVQNFAREFVPFFRSAISVEECATVPVCGVRSGGEPATASNSYIFASRLAYNIHPATLPDAEIFFGQAVAALTAGPMAANSCSASLTDFRRSALRAFQAAGPKSDSGLHTLHAKQGFLVSHVKQTL